VRYYHSDPQFYNSAGQFVSVPFAAFEVTAFSNARSFVVKHMEDFLSDFRQTIDSASNQLLQISVEQSQTPRAAGKWSPKEIIGHLIDSASNNHQRFVRAQFTDDLIFAGYEQEGWVRVQNYQGEQWADLVQLWKLYNQHMLHLISRVPEETRMKLRYKHNLHQLASESLSENEPVTLDWFMRDYVDHMKKHLKQILG
jgi:hypothetical protein